MGKAADNTPIDGDKDIDGGIAVGMDTVVDMDVVVGMDVVVDTVQLVPVHEVAFGLVDTMVVDMEGKADIVVVEDIVDTVDIVDTGSREFLLLFLFLYMIFFRGIF